MIKCNVTVCGVIEQARIESAGGKIHQTKMSIGEHGHIVLAIDTEGNMFGIHSMQ
jgi:predicted enzyme related to lactoylglutathione lyase